MAEVFTDEIHYWQRRFRLLIDWSIIYNRDNTLTGQSTSNADSKRAEIFPYSSTGETTSVDYILHEIIHIAIKAMGGDREKEEIFVQDVCEIITINRKPLTKNACKED